MLGFFRREAPALHAYGKLPLAKDYLRVGAGDGAARELREWLDAGFSGRSGAGEPAELPWPERFVFESGRGEPLLGSAWPSSDAGGLRRFPFALFVERRRKALLESLERGFAGEEAWWARIEAFHAASRNFADGQSFLTELRGKTIEVVARPGDTTDEARRGSGAEDAGADSEAEHVSWPAWTAALWPQDPQEGLFDTLRAVAQLARNDHASPLRLPLVSDLPIPEQVAAWCRALRELGWVARGALPSLFFPSAPTGSQPAFLVAFRRPLAAAQAAGALPWLTRPAGAALLDAGDLCDGALRTAGAAALQSGPSLSDSMRGALASFRARP